MTLEPYPRAQQVGVSSALYVLWCPHHYQSERNFIWN